MNLCDDHSWGGDGKCPHCEDAWRNFESDPYPYREFNKAKLKASALAKLTPEEREALGV